MKLKIIFLLIIIGVNAVEKARFDNYRVYKVEIEDEKQMELMDHINDYPNGYEFMSSKPAKIGADVHLMVPPHKFGEWSEYVENFNLKTILTTNNLQENMDKERKRPSGRATLDWTFYWTYDEINQWLDGIIAQYPASVTPFVAGLSYENRQIRGVRVNIGGGSNKKDVVVEATLHAAEWITIPSATYLLNEFLTSTDPTVMEVARRYIWHFIIVANPDGYIYSWNTYRLWRKTRAPSSPTCYGVDLNRNFDNHWALGGHSTDPCNRMFSGHYAFSEVEARVLADYYTRIPNFSTYHCLHSFGEMFITSPGWTYDLPENHQQLFEIAARASESIEALFGTRYRTGTITYFFSILTGTSLDWVNAELRTNISYVYEFRDTGLHGFILPPDQIYPNVLEFVASVITIMQEGYRMGLA